MEQAQSMVKAGRDRCLLAFRNYLDPAYFILTMKTSLSQDEVEFLDVYSNTVGLHMANILLTVPASISYFKYLKARRAKPVDEKSMSWARRRMLIYMPLCFSTMLTAYLYQKKTNFNERLAEVEQFYLQHKEEDINAISFNNKVLQAHDDL